MKTFAQLKEDRSDATAKSSARLDNLVDNAKEYFQGTTTPKKWKAEWKTLAKGGKKLKEDAATRVLVKEPKHRVGDIVRHQIGTHKVKARHYDHDEHTWKYHLVNHGIMRFIRTNAGKDIPEKEIKRHYSFNESIESNARKSANDFYQSKIKYPANPHPKGSDSHSEWMRHFKDEERKQHKDINKEYKQRDKYYAEDVERMNELHDEPDRPGVGIGLSNREGMNVTEEPRKTLKLTKADWDHHTRHSTAQYDHEGNPWIVQKDPSGAAVRIPVQITEDYPYRKTLRGVLKEAFPPKPEDNTGTEKPVSDTAKMVKDTVKKDKSEKPSSNSGLTIGKTKDTFEPDPVLTPVLSVANMPGGSVR